MTYDTTNEISRRIMLAGLAATPAAGTILSPSSGQAATRQGGRAYNYRDPVDNVHALARIFGDTSGRPTYEYIVGRVDGVIEGELSTPLMRYHAGRVREFRPKPDGGWHMLYRGVILFTDLKTDQVIDSFTVPYTGLTERLVHFRTALGEAIYAPEGIIAPPSFVGQSGEKLRPYVLPWTFNGDMGVVEYDERVAYIRPTDGARRVDNAVYRYMFSKRELESPRKTSVPFTMMWSTELNWFTWMKMGTRPGHLMWAGIGRKYDRLNQLPQTLLDATEVRFPGTFSKPLDWSVARL
jgi:Protein of unknown function (DUF1838)